MLSIDLTTLNNSGIILVRDFSEGAYCNINSFGRNTEKQIKTIKM